MMSLPGLFLARSWSFSSVAKERQFKVPAQAFQKTYPSIFAVVVMAESASKNRR